MWKSYSFDFLRTVSKQLVEELEKLSASQLTEKALLGLLSAQSDTKMNQGVYAIYLDGVPVYLGKANNVRERLSQHLKKLSGRQNIHIEAIGFKVLLLDDSMGTAANERNLIDVFSVKHPSLWNGRGFGPKDPGKNRDRTQPSYFDQHYPITKDYPVTVPLAKISIGDLFAMMKSTLPFVFRYQTLPAIIRDINLDLIGVPTNAKSLLEHAVQHFPPNWHGAIIAYGMVVYKGSRPYWHTAEVFVSRGSTKMPLLTGGADEDEEDDLGEAEEVDGFDT